MSQKFDIHLIEKKITRFNITEDTPCRVTVFNKSGARRLIYVPFGKILANPKKYIHKKEIYDQSEWNEFVFVEKKMTISFTVGESGCQSLLETVQKKFGKDVVYSSFKYVGER
jgi:hypothetical protein